MIERVGESQADADVAFAVSCGRACRGCAGGDRVAWVNEPRTASTVWWLESLPLQGGGGCQP